MALAKRAKILPIQGPRMLRSTREFVDALRRENEIVEITDVVDPFLELAEIQRQVVYRKGPALLFSNVKNCTFPVATNLYGSQKRIDIAFGSRPIDFIKSAVETFEKLMPPTPSKIWAARGLAWDVMKVGTRKVKNAPLLQKEITDGGLEKLPQLVCWQEDGGAFVTLPLVYTEHPISRKSNLGMYRIQLHNARQCGMHIQIHRGGGFHHHEAERNNQALPVHIYTGGPPALVIAAIAPLPEDVPEILLASLLAGGRLGKTTRQDLSPYPFLSDADFCIVGEIPPHQKMPEGPFGDHYGYYSLKHDYPFANVKHIFHRPDAIYPATVVGRPPQEDHFIACYLQDLLKPLIHMVMPQVKQVWAFEESGVHSLAGAVVRDRYPREALTTALRILGEGQLSLSKCLMVTDQDIDVKNFTALFTCILERIDFRRDLFVLSNISQDTLDYTSGKINEGSKAIFLGLGEKKRELPHNWTGELGDTRFKNPRVFCPGAVCIEATSSHIVDDNLAHALAQNPALQNWPMVFIVDDADDACASPEDFVWHIFTRFEPARDIYALKSETRRFHVELTPPIVIDCRMKSWYPKVLESDPAIVKKVAPLVDRICSSF